MMKSNRPLGFKAIGLKYKLESSAEHMVYIKQHTVREKHPEKPSDRTLFMLNVPPYCTEESIIYAWRDSGPVKSVYFHSKPNAGVPPVNDSPYFPIKEEVKGFKVAYVVFEKPEGLEKALEQTLPLILSSQEVPLLCGVKKWCRDYNARILNVGDLQSDIDQFMAKYDKRVMEQRLKEKEGEEEDEDGWVTVTKRGRNPGFSRTENSNKRILAQEEKKKSKKQLLNIYSFQIREAKMKNLMNLRQKFEEDKKKIHLLKQVRKFKPF